MTQDAREAMVKRRKVSFLIRIDERYLPPIQAHSLRPFQDCRNFTQFPRR
jgi:hypothetical protein